MKVCAGLLLALGLAALQAPLVASATDGGGCRPAVTIPAVTAPPVTAPPVADPSVTAPSVTAPSVTAPAVTAPAVTAPAVTAPAVARPPAVAAPVVVAAAAPASVASPPAVTAPASAAPATAVPAASVATCEPSAQNSNQDTNQAAYEQLRNRFSGDMAQALATENRLSATLEREQSRAQALTSQVRKQKARVSALAKQIRDLDRQLTITQDRITVEQGQVSAMARAMYRRPGSLPLLLARSGSIREALQLTADLMIAGERAHSLQARLEADLARQTAERQARESERQQADTARRELEVSIRSVEDAVRRQVLLLNELQGVISRMRLAMTANQDQPPAVMTVLAQLLEHLQQSVVLRSYQVAAHQVRAGAGLGATEGTYSAAGKASTVGIHLSWPLADARLTQAFGPTDFWLAPPLGLFDHFHTGLDMAAPEATPVLAAADGTVASVTRSGVGYGNYVILEHEPGVMTLYGHLLDAAVLPGEKVTRGQPIGFEGSTGFSTGAHLHFELRVNEQFVDPTPYLPAQKASPASPDEDSLAPRPASAEVPPPSD